MLQKISEWKIGGFYSNFERLSEFAAAGVEKARIWALNLSSRHLIRNLGAGPWPGRGVHTLSRHTLTPLLLTRSPTEEARQRDGSLSERFTFKVGLSLPSDLFLVAP